MTEDRDADFDCVVDGSVGIELLLSEPLSDRADALFEHFVLFIEQNRDGHPIYSTDPGAEIRNLYELPKEGPLCRVRAGRKRRASTGFEPDKR